MRHGTSDHNKFFIINESDLKPSNLTSKGKQEVEKSAKALKEIVNLDKIYCSPLMRCRQTAKIVQRVF